MKVLVTGASGFLGSHVAEQLAAGGHAVRALVRKTSSRKHLEDVPRIEFAEGSVEDAPSVARAAEGVDAVVHIAGIVKARNSEEFFATNVGGTQNVLAAAKGSPTVKRFVFASSQAVAGPSEDGSPVPIDREPRPVTHYGRSKLASEQAVLDEKDRLHVVVIRPPLIYGPRDTATLEFFQWVARGVRLVYGDGGNTLSVIYASDCAAAFVRALTADVPSGARYFVEDGRVHVWRDVIGEIEHAVGKKTFVRFGIPLRVVKGYAAISEAYGKIANKAVMVTRDKFNELSQRHWVCDGTATRTALGWEPKVPLGEGLERTARWYRQEGWL
jgi:nucleoside-diphosphate-sugar epimerase